MTKQLSNISDEATERTNTTGTLTPILEFEPDDGLAWIIENFVKRGDETGVPVFGEFKDSNDDPLPQNTTMALEFEAPNDDKPRTVSEKKSNIRAYNSLSIQDQQNEEYIDRVKHVLKGSALEVQDVDKFYISILSSEQVDWANSRATIDENAVTEVND